MAVPKRKTSKSKNRKRHSHDALVPNSIAYDSDGNLHLSHRATYVASEGAYYYKGRLVHQAKKSKKANNEA